jgi:chloramphenicol 3-O phosphotransferase
MSGLAARPIRDATLRRMTQHDVKPGLGRVVILNGAPRAGKSTIARAVQESSAELWLNLGLELFKAATPMRYQPGIGLRPGGERADLEPYVECLYLAMYESIAAHSRRGVNVVVDVTHHDSYSRPLSLLPKCARLLAALPVLVVGVRCPLEVVMERRQRTWGWSYDDDGSVPEPILRWQSTVHIPGVYDLEIDTSQTTPDNAASLIERQLATGEHGHAVRSLAAMASG